MTILLKMTEADMKRAAEQIPHICEDYCGRCPSYVGIGETKLAFCTQRKSEITKEHKGRLYPQCPMSKHMILR